MSQSFKDNDFLVPTEISNAILLKGFEESVIGKLATRKPIKLGVEKLPIYGGGIELDVVGETDESGTSDISLSHKEISPIEVSTIVPVSRDFARRNPSGVFELIEEDLRNAVARAYDSIFLAGKTVRGNAVLGQTNINQTLNQIEVVGGDYNTAIRAAIKAVGGADYDVTGMGYDSKLAIDLAEVVNQVQVGLPNLAAGSLTIAGYPAHASRNIGKAGLDLVVGDFNLLHAGYAEDLEVSVSDQATISYKGEQYNLWQRRMVGLQVTAKIGGVVIDPSGFAVVKTPVTP